MRVRKNLYFGKVKSGELWPENYEKLADFFTFFGNFLHVQVTLLIWKFKVQKKKLFWEVFREKDLNLNINVLGKLLFRVIKKVTEVTSIEVAKVF